MPVPPNVETAADWSTLIQDSLVSAIMAGVSAAAAVIALFYAINSWMSLTWSVADYFDPTVLDVLL